MFLCLSSLKHVNRGTNSDLIIRLHLRVVLMDPPTIMREMLVISIEVIRIMMVCGDDYIASNVDIEKQF